ncbi:HNH endonuclease [Erythrobacter aurantius]|uniref:HNH endonuclease n=1 Tax=Erythrobacter aurantius TaxID=2909249 RepID=UPI00207A9D40|nr:HNH endonuclease signature motif containing protein [Erythrobacter aurantius]
MFTLGVTDPRWHRFLLEHPQSGPLNFWTPTPWKPKFTPGMSFGFMVKSPYRKVGGFGTFRTYEEMDVNEAWARFRLANGVPSESEFRSRIIEFASRRSIAPYNTTNPHIGCILLDDCVFFPEDQMVQPEDIDLDFPKEIVKYKRFFEEPDLTKRFGVVEESCDFELVEPDEAAWSTTRAKRRKSQGVFREAVLRAYGRRCALSAETCPTVLEASHIQPFYSERSNHIQNGLCLRVDIHRLFDAGLISIGRQLEVLVSSSVLSAKIRSWAVTCSPDCYQSEVESGSFMMVV